MCGNVRQRTVSATFFVLRHL